MDIKMVIVQRGFDIAGNVIADLLSKPDWESRTANITQFYKDLEPVKKDLPEAPAVREIPERRGGEDKIVDEICTPDLSPKELLECRSCVEDVLKGQGSDVMQKYFEPSL